MEKRPKKKEADLKEQGRDQRTAAMEGLSAKTNPAAKRRKLNSGKNFAPFLYQLILPGHGVIDATGQTRESAPKTAMDALQDFISTKMSSDAKKLELEERAMTLQEKRLELEEKILC